MESTATTSTLSWQTVLSGEKEKPYFTQMMDFLNHERAKGKIIYPPPQDVFNAIKSTPFDRVKVVILGQDPYHGPNQAHGLCFSVRPGVPAPPSLVNIFQELQTDLGIPISKQGYLQKWADQGVLLLNTVLTVEAGKAHSHAKIGWETFTDRIIQELNDKCSGLVFLLWGSHAQHKCEIINPTRHFLLKAPHPSPLSAHRGFFGCKHFSKCNEILKRQDKEPIDWSL
jgi:uracil-DNA glycosylase